MKVWAVFTDDGYEGPWLESLWSDKDKADKEVAVMINEQLADASKWRGLLFYSEEKEVG